MQFVNREQLRAAQETKDKLRELMIEKHMTQEELEHHTGAERSTISRFCNPQTEQYPDIFLITNCLISKDAKAIEFALAFLDYLESQAGREATPLNPAHIADGSLLDEFKELAIIEGDFAKALDKDIMHAEKIAFKIREVYQKMMIEIRERRIKRRAE